MGRLRLLRPMWVSVILLVACAATTAAAASLNQGILEFRRGDLTQALATFAAVLADEPGNTSARFWLGRGQLASGHYEAAADTFERVLAQYPGSVDAHYWLAMTYLRWGRAGEARTHLETVLKLDPQHAAAREALAQIPQTATAPPSPQPAPQPTAGSRLALDAGTLPVDVGTVDLVSGNVYDYTFSSAPTDWLARSGLWAITNRWTCSPQWSWEGGFAAEGPAALWNKREFTGDVTVETYFGFKMGMGEVHSYKNPTDLNISLCADGANLDSGYAFMVGAAGNTDSRIMRGSRVLGAGTSPQSLLPIFEDGYPSTYDFHRKWWSVRVRKHGGKLELYLDERLVAEATDPAPLNLGRVALWTYDNGIIVSRVKIYYEGERQERTAIPGEEQLRPTRTRVAPSLFTVSSSTHPSVQNDFETDLGTWAVQNEKLPVALTLAEPGAGDTGHCLAVTNAISGGTFGATVIPGEFLVDEVPQLAFDYKLPADGGVKANLYLELADQQYEVIFCGPPSGAARAEQIGAIQGVRADGQWHRAEFDLLGSLRHRLGTTKPLRARALWLGNLCEENYLLAGFGANRLGATYWLDNFTLDRPGDRQVRLAFVPRPGTAITGYSVALDSDPATRVPETVTTTESSVALTAERDGTSYVHVRARQADGTWTATRSHRVRIDQSPPEIAGLNPPPGQCAPDAPITVSLRDTGGGGIDEESLKLSVNGTSVPLDGTAAAYDPAAGALQVDPRRVLTQFPDGAPITIALAPVKDRVGNQMAAGSQWAYRIAYANDTTPPPAPELKFGADAYLCDEDYEHAIGEFVSYGGPNGARLSLDDTTAASGRRSLRIYNPVESGRYGIIRRGSFDAGKYRILSFDYKIPARLRVDIALYVNGDMKAIKFKDTDNTLGYIGTIADVRDDNQWHHAEVNLYDMLRADDPGAASYVVDQFVIADWNWKANMRGQVYNLDNFQIIPVTSARAGLPLAWRAADISGLSGLAWGADTTPTTEAPRTVALTGQAGTLTGLPTTNGWLHARVRDGAGNWSATRTTRLVADSDCPTAQITAPPAGQTLATSTVTLRLADQGVAGIDPASVVLAVAGVDYTVKSGGVGGLTYDSTAASLVWNCEQVTPQPIVIPDRTRVEVALKAARDYAGNAVAELPRTSWMMDYSQDKTGPTVAELRSTTHRTLLTDTFEDGLHGWSTLGGDAGAKVERDTTTAASGKACVKLTQQNAGGQMSATITREPFQADSYPVVSFDYRVPANVRLDLVAHMADGNDYAIAFTDNPTGAVGRVPNVRADGTWRHAVVDLQPLLRQKQPKDSLDVAYLYLADRNNLENPPGVSAWFDNFIIGMVGTRGPVLRWKATDTTGITGYSYALDREPGTAPDETTEGTAQSFSKTGGLERGRWYFHIRALDGAGNWGPTTHYALMHLTAN